MIVADHEVDPGRHNAYLDVLGRHSSPLGAVMLVTGNTASAAARSGSDSDLKFAEDAMRAVGHEAREFLDALASTTCPPYLRGADSQVQGALKLLIDGGRRGAEAAKARNLVQLEAAAHEMELFNREVVAAAHRLTEWRSGAARP